jgi:arginine deiminase
VIFLKTEPCHLNTVFTVVSFTKMIFLLALMEAASHAFGRGYSIQQEQDS